MQTRYLTPGLAIAAGSGTLAFAQGSMRGEGMLAWAGAALTAAAFVVAAVLQNRGLWRLAAERIRPEAIPIAAMRNARLMAGLFAWAGVSLGLGYAGMEPRWYHWWQYATAMGLMALALLLYARALAAPDHPLRRGPGLLLALRLVTLQAALAIGGVAWLVMSGKIASTKPDWAANIVFVAGGLAVAVLSALAAYTQLRLSRRH